MDITLLSWFQIILSVVLIGLVLLQNKGEDGLGGAFGGSGGGGNFHTRRGLEQTIFIVTIIVGVLFFGTAIAILLLS